MRLYLGLVGATKQSYVALATARGEILAHKVAPPLAMRATRELGTCLQASFGQLARMASLSYERMVARLHCACIAMGGVHVESDVAALRQILSGIGFRGPFHLLLSEDTHAHLAANFIACGGLAVAGTGSIVFVRVEGEADAIRVNGWGPVLGDRGSGYDLGISCLRAILEAVDGRAQRSQLLESEVLNHIGLYDPTDILPWYYSVMETPRWRSEIADIALPLLHAAEISEDPLARSIVVSGAASLLSSLKIASQKAAELRNVLSFEPLPLVLEGGLFRNSEIYQGTFATWAQVGPESDVQWVITQPRFTSVVGALALAITGSPYVDPDTSRYFYLQASSIENGLALDGDG